MPPLADPPAELVDAVYPVLPFRVDLKTGDGFETISTDFSQKLIDANIELTVYERIKSFYKEEYETVAVNVYGKTKLAAEQHIIASYDNYAILRSSIICGQQTISPVTKSVPIQWIDSVLKQGQEVEFFHDEFRSPVNVKDVVDVIITLTTRWLSDGKHMQLLLNVGGPDRVSRLQMAETVVRVIGNQNSLIKSISASSVNSGVKSPADIYGHRQIDSSAWYQSLHL